MELRHLRYFLAVAEERHFGRAAERLHMAQPPLSQQIRRLEAELGVELFYRTTRRVELAPAGELLVDRARRILRAVDEAVENAHLAASGEVGRVTIGFTGSATYGLLPVVASTLRETLPRLDLCLHGEMLTPAQVDALVEGQIDLGILRPPRRRHDLIVEVVRREPLIAALPADHPLAALDAVPIAALADVPFVTRLDGDAVGTLCETYGFRPQIVLVVEETSTLISVVAAGVGVTMVPSSVSHMVVDGAVYRPLEGDSIHLELALARRRDDESPVIARAWEIVSRAVAAAPELGSAFSEAAAIDTHTVLN